MQVQILYFVPLLHIKYVFENLKLIVVKGHKLATVNVTDFGFYTAALSSAIQHAMPSKFGFQKWEL